MKQGLSTAEQAQVRTLAAEGWPPYRIGRELSRSPHTIARFLKQPAVATDVRDEKAELAQVYREKARKVVESISDTDISDASLQQKCVSTGILLDKSLLLSGDATSNINVRVLIDLASLVRGDLPLPLLPHDPPTSL